MLGLGASSNVIVEQWNGILFQRALAKVAETVDYLRAVLAGDRGAGGFKLASPPEEPVPIVLAALRDKMLRLAGRAHLTVTTQAIGETSERISRYLLTFALLNIGFGTLITVGLWLLGVPHWGLWGVMAGLLRFGLPACFFFRSLSLPVISIPIKSPARLV